MQFPAHPSDDVGQAEFAPVRGIKFTPVSGGVGSGRVRAGGTRRAESVGVSWAESGGVEYLPLDLSPPKQKAAKGQATPTQGVPSTTRMGSREVPENGSQQPVKKTTPSTMPLLGSPAGEDQELLSPGTPSESITVKSLLPWHPTSWLQ